MPYQPPWMQQQANMGINVPAQVPFSPMVPVQNNPHMGLAAIKYLRDNLLGEKADKLPGESIDEYIDRLKYEIENPSLMYPEPKPTMAEIDAWHGSPHHFDKFKMSKVGTGEGVQAFGHGLSD